MPFLFGCASVSQQAAAPPIPAVTCKAGPDCDAKWSRAVSWVTTNSAYKLGTQTDSVIQTKGPSDSDPSPAYTVTKVAKSPGIYEFTFTGGCDNIFGCVPEIPVARAKFTGFVLGAS
jgi:hypothetical protein